MSTGQKHRTLVIGAHHNPPRRARRREQRSEAFLARMKTRNGIEATQSELVRAHGLRQARYRGKAKVDLQNQFIGAACNIKRWLKLMAWKIKQNLPPDFSTPAGGIKPGFLRLKEPRSRFPLTETRLHQLFLGNPLGRCWFLFYERALLDLNTLPENQGFFSGIKI